MTVIALPVRPAALEGHVGLSPQPPAEIRLLHLPATPLPQVVESEALWKDWDDAVQKQDLRFGGGQ